MTTRSAGSIAAAAAIVVAGSAFVRDAKACGGCYHRPAQTETTVVTGHRMAVAVSPTQTILWDQIQYSGDPTEFAWVLPVKPGARLELATDAWFETLDAATATHVVAPPLDCPPPPRGETSFGCGSAAEDLAAGGPEQSGDNSVTILHEGTVGPYETVTLSATQPGALNTWLSDHGFAVGANEQPIIDAYVAEGFDFIALRLQPGVGVRAMKPVRVVSPGASPSFPLRMVAAGTGPQVAITLFVIGEGRWATANFPNGTVPLDDLSWDYVASASNYAELRQGALAANDGRTWLTTYAHAGALLSPVSSGNAAGTYFGATPAGMPITTIGDAYVGQAIQDAETGIGSCPTSFDTLASSASLVVDTCPAGTADPSTCPAPPPGDIDARTFACGTADDLAVALTGMHPRDVWLVRLEANLPHAALATDLSLQASQDQSEIDNWLQPRRLLRDQDLCRSNGAPAAMIAPARGRPRGGQGVVVLIGLGVLGVGAALRRAGIRRRR